MANSYIDYTGNGSLTTFTTPPYLAQAHLVVAVDGVTKTLGTDYTINTNSTSLVFTTAPEASAKIRISRNSSQNERLTDYSNASLLTAEQMDTDANQLFYMAQEAADTAASTDFAANTFYTSATTTPASGNVGDLFFNTSTGLLSIYSGTAWNAVNSRGDKQTFAISTSTTVFTPNNPVDDNTLVFLNGVLLVKGASSAGDYITTTTQVTLNTAVTSGVVEIVSFPNAAFVGTVNAVDGVFSGDITCNDLTTASLSLTYDSSSLGFNTPKTILRETGNGDFRIEGQDVLLRVSDGNVNFATGVVYTRVECTAGSTGSVKLRHGTGDTKLETTDGGINVIGGINADLLTLDRVNTASEGGQLNFAKAIDNTDAWYIDVYGDAADNTKMRFVNTTDSLSRLEIVDEGINVTGTVTCDEVLNITSDGASADPRPQIKLYNNNADGLPNERLGQTLYYGKNAAATPATVNFGWQEMKAVVVTEGAEEAEMNFYVRNANAHVKALSLQTDGINVTGTVTPSGGYKSSDGTAGYTGNASASATLTIKDGLIVAVS
jgi:hypothetical protein